MAAAFVGGGCLRVGAPCRKERRGNSDLLFGSVILQNDGSRAVLENPQPAGQREQEAPLKKEDILRVTAAELFTARMGTQGSECTLLTDTHTHTHTHRETLKVLLCGGYIDP
ncbi:hypothetical protein EYF80_019547 [Xyrichtys novacula]|uniref:Uncharacterized protein n=1 Tax=Xyrichtys novacula TaxID=13765 RepID=A0AAV1FBQ8_XYRNO|nr:hypothetical protein EYF80_019547 [Xyrichtys novacula]